MSSLPAGVNQWKYSCFLISSCIKTEANDDDSHNSDGY